MLHGAWPCQPQPTARAWPRASPPGRRPLSPSRRPSRRRAADPLPRSPGGGCGSGGFGSGCCGSGGPGIRSAAGDSGRAGSVRPLAQDGQFPHHDLKGHSVPRGVHCPELLQSVVLVVEPAPDSDYRQPPGTRPLRCRCPAMPDTGRPVLAGGSLHGNHLHRPLA